MIIDAVSAASAPSDASFTVRAIASFLAYIERRLGVRVVRDARDQIHDPLLLIEYERARSMVREGVIRDFGRSLAYADEPRLMSWYATTNTPTDHRAGGTTWGDDAGALAAALSEARERFLWLTRGDLTGLRDASVPHMRGVPHVSPDRFAGFTDEQRKIAGRELLPDAVYRWVPARSLVSKQRIYVPLQCVSGHYARSVSVEPLIRPQTTNGLATWRTRGGAQLRGLLELVERDAYLITWLNQMTLPKFSLEPLAEKDPILSKALRACKRYGLRVHAVRLLTDAPTYATAVVIEDVLSSIAPRFAIGLGAHRLASSAILKATTEALRARRGYRTWSDAGNTWSDDTPAQSIGHRERVHYWGVPANAKGLEFLIAGEEAPIEGEPWGKDSEEEHLARLVNWCREKGYECASVSFATPKTTRDGNYVEMIVAPELTPMYLTESTQAFGSERIRAIPEMFGYEPRHEPYGDAPHPFS